MASENGQKPTETNKISTEGFIRLADYLKKTQVARTSPTSVRAVALKQYARHIKPSIKTK
jgi:uncharacterized lipoprotein YmbA